MKRPHIDVDLLRSQYRDRPQLQDYEVLGIGYSHEGNYPIGWIVMHFSDTNQARADLEPRRQLVTEGLIRSSLNLTYDEAYFTLMDAYVVDQQIALRVRPSYDQPGWLFWMEIWGDMTYATCP
jgi:hypothetical protein